MRNAPAVARILAAALHLAASAFLLIVAALTTNRRRPTATATEQSMPMHRIRERDIPALGYDATGGTIVKVSLLEDDGTTARIQVQDCGVAARQGQIHTVASSAVRRHDQRLT
jgi:hypothetical protein